MIRDTNHTEYMTWMLNKPDYFKTMEIVHPNNKLNRAEIFLSIDFKEDYRNMLKIYDHFKGKIPPLEKIIEWIDKNPELLSKLVRRRKIKEKRDFIKKKKIMSYLKI